MKVALSFPRADTKGGVERVIRETALYLAGRGHEVSLFVDTSDLSDTSNLEIRHVGSRPRPTFLQALSFQRKCSHLLDPTEFDAVGSFGVPSPLDGVFWVPSVHRAWLEHSRHYRTPFSKSRIKQRLNPIHPIILRMEKEHFTPGNYRRLVALTEDVKGDLIRFYDVPEGDVDVIPIGFDPDQFSLEQVDRHRSTVRAELGFQSSDRVIAFVANELQRKGFTPLTRAVAACGDPNLKILVVGRADPAGNMLDARRLGLGDRIVYAGSSSQVQRYLAAADLFVLPTQYEAWGLVIAEALACGLPVLTSALAGASVAVSDVGGILLEDPTSVDEIAWGITALIGHDHDHAAISRSVQWLRWDQVLPRYEQTLLDASR